MSRGDLARFVNRHAKPEGEVWIVDPDRGDRPAFNRRMADAGFVLARRADRCARRPRPRRPTRDGCSSTPVNSIRRLTASGAVLALSSTMSMTDLQELLDSNRRWAAKMEAARPGFFTGLLEAAGAAVPVDRLRGQPRAGERAGGPRAGRAVRPSQRRQRRRPLGPELPLGDPVRGRRARGQHIIVVGHSRCGGVIAALDNRRVGLADNWIRHVQDVRNRHAAWLESCPSCAASMPCASSTSSSRRSTCARRRWCRKRGRRPGARRARLGLRPAERAAEGPRHDGDAARRRPRDVRRGDRQRALSPRRLAASGVAPG